MQNRLERLIKLVYKDYKADNVKVGLKVGQAHPDEEALACFLEGRLTKEEDERIKAHLISCDNCLEAVSLSLGAKPAEAKEVPAELLAWLKDLPKPENRLCMLEIILKVKEKALEILNTTGDILVGQELVPAPVLRSRSIKDFKDQVTILKDFQDIRVEVRIENKAGKDFNVNITVTHKQTQKVMRDLRVTLIKDDLELESYLADSGSVTFEHVLLGKYIIEISSIDNKLASILLETKA